MVIFQGSDGSPGYNQFNSLEDAVAFVERLRNDDGLETARMFALEEIKYDLQPTYKVQIAALMPGAAPAVPAEPEPSPIVVPATDPIPAPVADVPADPPPAPEPAIESPVAQESPSAFSAFSSGSTEDSPPPPPPASEPVTEEPAPARRGLFGR